jgi:hypothetical protein
MMVLQEKMIAKFHSAIILVGDHLISVVRSMRLARRPLFYTAQLFRRVNTRAGQKLGKTYVVLLPHC